MNFSNDDSKDGCDGVDDGNKNGKNDFEGKIIIMAVLAQSNVVCPQKQSPHQQQQLSLYCQLEQN